MNKLLKNVIITYGNGDKTRNFYLFLIYHIVVLPSISKKKHSRNFEDFKIMRICGEDESVKDESVKD